MPEMIFSIAANSDDGYVRGSSSTYPPTSGAATTTSTEIRVERSYTGTYDISVALLRFNTAALPDDVTVTGATLRIHQISVGTHGADLFGNSIEWYNPANWPIDGADFTNTYASTAWIGFLSNLNNGTVIDIPLSNVTANVNKTGYTALRIHETGDKTPVGLNVLIFAALEHATNPEPKLIVTYSESRRYQMIV